MLIKTGEFTALPQDFVDSYATKEVPWGPVGYVTAKRTYMRRIEDEGRTEEWHETCARSVNGLLELSREHANNILDEETAKTLYHYTYYLKSLFSGRHLWQLGTDLVRRLGQDSLQACWGIRMNDPILPFCFLFEELMLGGGVGFDIHPEAVFEMPAVRFAPKITRADNDNDVDRIVRDNREGWVELLREVLEAHFFTGKDYTFATHCIRDRGAKIRSFGGTASGPELLSWGMLEISRILRERHNSTTQKLRPVDVLDICNIIGSVVVAGNARRSAQLALGSYRDRKYLKAKDWSEGSIPNWRGMSNNSVAVSTIAKLGELFWKTYDGNGEPYGLFNPRLAREFGRLADGRGYRSDLDIVVTNPCSEITLCPYESCNLYDIVLPRLKDAEEFRTAARLGYLTTKIISCVPALYEETNRIREQNHRLGIGVTGFLQAKRFHDADLFGSIYRHIEELDEHYSPLMGVGKSIKLTTVKPSGTMSLLPGVSHGVHPAFAPYYIRRIRMANGDPLVDACRAHGFNVEPMLNQDRTRDHNTMVVEFPVKHDADVYKDDISAIQQLEYASWLQEHWSDNSVSCSVYYSPDELPDIKAWLSENYETRIKSVSFFLRQKHGFLHAPYEEISQERYAELAAKCTPLTAVADPGGFEIDEGCDNGVCPTR